MSIHLKRIVFYFCILNFGLGCCLGTRANADDNLMHRIFIGMIFNNSFPAIGGRVIFNGSGLPGVEIFNQNDMDDILPGQIYKVAVTDSKGEYRAGFSPHLYFIYPEKYGYQFDPSGSWVSHNDGIQDFTAYKHTISGTVKEKDTGKRLEKVEIYGDVYVKDKDQFVKKLLATTNSNGYYETEENAGIDFTLTAQLTGYEFPALGIPIIGTEYLHENKDFTATKLAPLVNISGKVIWFNTPNSYTAAMEAYAEDGSLYSRTATDVDGNYSIPVPVGWTGTVKPFSLGFEFDPVKRDYVGLRENKTLQNYDPFVCTGEADYIVGKWAFTYYAFNYGGGEVEIKAATTGSCDYVGKVTKQGTYWKEHDMKIGDEVWWLRKQSAVRSQYSGTQLTWDYAKGTYGKWPLAVWIKGNTLTDAGGMLLATKVP